MRWQQVIDAAAPDLAPLNGSSPQVGVVGYTLGGGLSPTMGRYRGWAADHVRAVELVTADGRLRQLTAERESDLFWAVRGGKDNFGIVTALEFSLFETPQLFGGGLYFPGELASDVLHAYRAWTATVPDAMTSSVALLRMPPLPIIPEPLRGRFTVHVRIAYLGSPAEGGRLVQPLRRIGPAIIDSVGEMPYTAAASIHGDPPVPLPADEGSLRLRELPEAAVDAVLESAGANSDCPLVMVELRHLGGALGRPPEVPNAVTGREAAFQVFAAGVGEPDNAAALYASEDELFRRLQPWKSDRRGLNYLFARDTAPDHVRAAFGLDTYQRLARIKHVYDPVNMFRINHNIPPAP